MTNKPTQLLFPSQGFFPPQPPREIETNELLIWQYDLRNIFALSEKFLSYLKEEGKGLVLRMAGYWSQEVLNVRWDYALQEVEEVGGKGGGHQKHLHLHLKKGQYQQQNFISQNTVSGQSNDWFSLAAYKELHLQCLSSCSPTLIMGINYFAGLWKQQTRYTHTYVCANFSYFPGLSIKKQHHRLWNSLLFICEIYNIKTLEFWTKNYVTLNLLCNSL